MRSNPSGSTNCLPHDLQRKFCLMRMFLLRWPFFTIESDLQKIHRLDIINHLREYIEPTYIYIIRLIDSIHPLEESLFSLQWYPQLNQLYAVKQDTPYGLRLYYDSKLRALIGFDVHDYALRVGQIQGAYREKEVLQYFTFWDSMLLEILTDFARQAGFKQVRVQRAERNKYWNGLHLRKSREVLAHQKRLQRRYDQSAERLGFKLDPIGLNDYVLDLEARVEQVEVEMHLAAN